MVAAEFTASKKPLILKNKRPRQHINPFHLDVISEYVTKSEFNAATGCLDEIMNSLSEHYKQEQEISQQIRSAVTYPLIMLGMMAVVILVLLVKVLPVFQQVFQQMGLEMNGVSRGLLNAGNVISHYSAVFLILAAVLIGFILFFQPYRKRPLKPPETGYPSAHIS